MEYKPNIYEYIESYFNGSTSLGMKPLIILDTCAIIDFESATRKQINFGYRRGHEFINKLSSLVNNTSFIIPDNIMCEIEFHKNCQISGTPEISEKTYSLLNAFAKNIPEDVKLYVEKANQMYEMPEITFSRITHPRIISGITPRITSENRTVITSSSNLDTNLYLAHWFLKLNMANLTTKKTVLDVISEPDMDLIRSALTIAHYSLDKFKSNQEQKLHKLLKGTYKIALLTSDAHVYTTLNELSREAKFAHLKEYLNPINIRKYDLTCDNNG